MDNSIEERRFSLESRRYIGCKTKLVDWIFGLIDEHTHEIHSFCDILQVQVWWLTGLCKDMNGW